jgi:hypothetical protein
MKRTAQGPFQLLALRCLLRDEREWESNVVSQGHVFAIKMGIAHRIWSLEMRDFQADSQHRDRLGTEQGEGVIQRITPSHGMLVAAKRSDVTLLVGVPESGIEIDLRSARRQTPRVKAVKHRRYEVIE